MSSEDQDFLKMSRVNEDPSPKNILLNNFPLKEFLGLTPSEMHSVIYDPFGEHSEFRINFIDDEILDKIPFFVLAENLLLIIYCDKKVKLTPKGFLPTKYCDELGRKKIIDEFIYQIPDRKRIGEDYLPSIRAVRIALMLGELIICKNNKITISDYGFQLLEAKNRQALFEVIFYAFTQTFLWAHLDGYRSELIGQLGFAFSISMLKHFGDSSRNLLFYANKYKEAFPLLMNPLKDHQYFPVEHQFLSCYRVRLFDRFFEWFGLVKADEYHILDMERCSYSKIEIVDKLFTTPELLEQFL